MSRAAPPTAASAPDRDVRRAVFEEEAARPSRRHVVVRGENFWTISRLYYGSGRYYLALWDANRDLAVVPESLRVGDAILVPHLDELDRSLEVDPATARLADGASAADAVRARRGGRPVAPGDPHVLPAGLATGSSRPADVRPSARGREGSRRETSAVHRVGRNETLRSIARDRLRDPNRLGEIYELNRGALPDSGQPTPGQRLILPGDALPARIAP